MPITLKAEKGSYLYEVLEEGRIVGFTQGMGRGMIRGMTMGQSRLLQRQLEFRFGPLLEPYLSRLKSAGDLQLEAWGLAILNAATLEDVFR